MSVGVATDQKQKQKKTFNYLVNKIEIALLR
jgi:hypothetical protein